MKTIRSILFLLAVVSASASFAEVRIRDIFAAAPDSIFPLLTKNNRLDCIDFCENNMPAVVKNRFDDRAELLKLTDRYLQLRTSERCVVEMRLLSDSLFCMSTTYEGPTADSHVSFFTSDWQPILRQEKQPDVEAFLTDDIDEEVRLMLVALPFVKAELSETENSLTWKLQTSELTQEQRKKAEGKIKDITISL